ncbi:MAG: mechanosensitive ion channel family protein [Salinisphaera sp.]|nr:mechanosensitive ion channel family protein [Salinisphaera sp.]
MNELVAAYQQFMDHYLSLHNQWGTALDMAVILVATGALDLITRLLFAWLYRKVSATDNLWDDALYRSFNGPLQALLWAAGLSIAIHIGSSANADWRVYVATIRRLAIVLIVAWFFFRLIGSIESNALDRAAQADNNLDPTTADAIAKLARGLVLILMALALLQEFGVPPSSLLAFSGIGGIAVGFAARDVLANIFGGMTVYLNRPFSVGDWIRSPDRDIEGVVEAIGWRATTVRRFDMRPLYVPNAVFSNVALENPSRMSHRRIMETIRLRYADAAAVPDIVEAIRDMLDGDDAIDSDQVVLTSLDSLSDSSLKLMVYCYTYTTDWAEYLAINQSVLQRIQDIVRDHDAAIAYPTTTLHIPGELQVSCAGGRHAGNEQEDIDTGKVQSERSQAVAREKASQRGRYGPDNASEEGQS